MRIFFRAYWRRALSEHALMAWWWIWMMLQNWRKTRNMILRWWLTALKLNLSYNSDCPNPLRRHSIFLKAWPSSPPWMARQFLLPQKMTHLQSIAIHQRYSFLLALPAPYATTALMNLSPECFPLIIRRGLAPAVTA